MLSLKLTIIQQYFSELFSKFSGLFVDIWMKEDSETNCSYGHIHKSAMLIVEFWKIQLSNETFLETFRSKWYKSIFNPSELQEQQQQN